MQILTPLFMALIVWPASGLPVETPQDTTRAQVIEEKSPRGAFFRSLAVPGWGQWYVGHKFRGGLYLATEVTLVGLYIRQRIQVSDLKAQRDPLLEQEIGRARERTEDLLFYSLAFLFFNGIDAFVGAHLYNFKHRITLEPEGASLGLSITLPVGR